MGGGHIESIDTPILGVVMRTPNVLLTIVSDGVALFCYLPFRAAGLGGFPTTVGGVSFASSTFLGITAALIPRECDRLG
jgi:hypothetical protein